LLLLWVVMFCCWLLLFLCCGFCYVAAVLGMKGKDMFVLVIVGEEEDKTNWDF
jgi:hypothetical protein